MIEIENLTKVYKNRVHALSGIDLSIGTGIFGLLGPNGAGKTSLMRILAGVLRPSGGRVTVLGNDLSTYAGRQAMKRHLGYLPQELGLYPTLTAVEFLMFVAALKGLSGAEQRREVDRVLDIVRLNDAAKQPLKSYSGGMKRRVGIAQALLGDVKLLIVDEPTTGLDPEERLRIRNTLTEVARQSTVILSTHIIEDINQSCRALAVIAQGKIVSQGTPAELTRLADGKVWTMKTSGSAPAGSLMVVSTTQFGDGLQYRVIGQPAPQEMATAAAPTLEDAYLLLMQQAR